MSKPLLLSVAAASLLLGGCALSPEEDPVQIRMNDLDARVQRIERVLTNQSLLDMAQRIDSLQSDLRSLRGEIELLQNQSEGGKTQQRGLYGDLDKRLAALEALQMSPPAAGTAQGTAGASEQAAYDSAFNALKNSDYPKAIAGFKQFLTGFPASPLASNAQYWLGEAYYVTREYASAGTAFQKVVTDWPESRKAPDALVKLGFTQSELKRFADARATLEEVTRRYPGSEAASLAAERLKRLPDGR